MVSIGQIPPKKRKTRDASIMDNGIEKHICSMRSHVATDIAS